MHELDTKSQRDPVEKIYNETKRKLEYIFCPVHKQSPRVFRTEDWFDIEACCPECWEIVRELLGSVSYAPEDVLKGCNSDS